MARPITYDPDAALGAALYTFWRNGWRASSIEDLVASTGVSRSGLYQTWGGKHGLFDACLERYLTQIADPLLTPLEAESAGLPEVRRYFDQLVEHVLGPAGGLGCFVVNSVAELGLRDGPTFERLRVALDRVHDAFANALTGAVARGQLAPEVPIAAHAAHLAICAQGLLLQGRSRPGEAAVRAFVSLSLASLPIVEDR